MHVPQQETVSQVTCRHSPPRSLASVIEIQESDHGARRLKEDVTVNDDFRGKNHGKAFEFCQQRLLYLMFV